MDPSQELDQSTPDTQPIPPRYWWLKRLTLAGVVTIAACVALRLWWGFEADRRLQALIDQYRAAGQPVLIEDFARFLSAPDEQNAALLLLEAAAKLDIGEDDEILGNELMTLSGVAEHLDRSAAVLERNRAVLTLVRETRSRPQAAWKTGMGSGAFFIFGPQRQILRLLTASIFHAFLTGDHAEALESIYDQIRQADAFAQHPEIIYQLVAEPCEGMALHMIEQLSAGLRFDLASDDRSIRPASRELAVEIIAFLTDSERRREQAIRAAQGSRAVSIAEWSTFAPAGVERIFAPATMLEVVYFIKLESRATIALAETTWPAARRNLETVQPLPPGYMRSIVRPYASIHYVWGDPAESRRSSVLMQYDYKSKRLMAAMALAIRLYQTDHGSRPEALGLLVPEYLPALPLDPFAETPATFRQIITPDGHVLYSVGPDGNDDGGVPTRREPGNYRSRERAGDIPFYLDGRPETRSSPPKASTQTGKDNIDSGEQGGDAEQNDAPGDRPK